MQQGDYSSYFHNQYPHLQNPIPNTNSHPSSYASAPPYTAGYSPSDYGQYPQNYPPYPQSLDPQSLSAPFSNPSTHSSAIPATATPNPQSSFNELQPPYDLLGTYKPSASQQAYFQPYDQIQVSPGYAPPPFSISSPDPPYTSPSRAIPYAISGFSAPPASDNPYSSMKFDRGGMYIDDSYGGYGRSGYESGSNFSGKRSGGGEYSRFDDLYGDGVYAYEGSKAEPYGARGTGLRSSSSTLFDNYGRPINMPSSGDSSLSSDSVKIVKAVPKIEEQQDAKTGVQKYHVKLLAEGAGQSTMDVLSQVGLDGIRMLDPSTSRTLRIYPLENITRCDVIDPSTFAFWSKSSVDIEPRRIRLQSNCYTTSTLLDTVTAAIVQSKEMGGTNRPSEATRITEQPSEKKKGLGDWTNLIKPVNVEKDHWVPDEAVTKCTACDTDFSAFVRKHHCRNCGDIFCDKCTQGRIALTDDENAPEVRVCDRCMADVTQRLSSTKETARNSGGTKSHGDLARKLQEEMEKNRKSSSGSGFDGGSRRRTKKVACPTCTVHLQVEVPASGSETIECGVCQNPFLVTAH